MLQHVDGSIVLPGGTLDVNGQVVNNALQQQQVDFATMNNEFGIPGLQQLTGDTSSAAGTYIQTITNIMLYTALYCKRVRFSRCAVSALVPAILELLLIEQCAQIVVL
jgi:hypothetical protein